MIRINLLPVRERRKKREGRQILLLFGILLIGEIVGLYYFYNSISLERSTVNHQVNQVQAEIKKRRNLQKRIQELQAQIGQLEAQAGVFDKLKEGKTGPAKLLLFLSYVVAERPDTDKENREELKVLERIGWDTNWDPNRIWLNSLSTKGKDLTLKGIAMSHEDVAEFSKRLQAGIFLPGVEPSQQVQKFDRELSRASVIYTIVSKVNYSIPEDEPAKKPGADGKKKTE